MERGEETPDEPRWPYAEISGRPEKLGAMMSLSIALVTAALHIDNQGIPDWGADLISFGFLVPWLFVIFMLNHFRLKISIIEYLSVGGPEQTISFTIYRGDRDSGNSDMDWTLMAVCQSTLFWDGPGQFGPKRDDRMLVKYERKRRLWFLPPFISRKYAYYIVPFEDWTTKETRRKNFPKDPLETQEELMKWIEEGIARGAEEKAEMGERKYNAWGEVMERWHEEIFLLGSPSVEEIELLGFKEIEGDFLDDFTRNERGWVNVWVPENPNLVEARLEEIRIYFEDWYEEKKIDLDVILR